MNIGRTLKHLPTNDSSAKSLAYDGWRLINNCEGHNAFGLICILARGTARAGIMRQGDSYALVEVEL